MPRKPMHKHTNDEDLPNGSIIHWSRKKDNFVPVTCAACNQQRTIQAVSASRGVFTGICQACANGTRLQDKTLPNGSIIFWSHRNKQQVPVKCGACGKTRNTHQAGVDKDFTGLCRSCLNTGSRSNNWRGGRINRNGYIWLKYTLTTLSMRLWLLLLVILLNIAL